jgi:hypothetical protein
MKKKIHILLVLIAVSMVFSSLTIASVEAQTTDKTCEQCGMLVDETSQAHFKVVDSNGNSHYVECMMCALKLLSKYDALNITTNCDYYGPSSVITVNAKQHGAVVTVTPPTALVIAGGGCAKNRVVSSQAAASALLANNGTSTFLAAIQRYNNGVNGTIVTVPLSASIMTITQAALQFGGATPSPSPSPPVPSIQVCEQCGMEVAADAQAHFKIVDREGKVHYACCIKCAIKEIGKLDEGNITTNCDWYGLNFPISIIIKDNLTSVTVNPSTAVIIDGSCTKNRVAYDDIAANALLANNGSSRYLIGSQNTTIPSNATIIPMVQAVKTFGVGSSPSPTPTATPSPYPSPSPTSSASLQPTPTTPSATSPTPQPTLAPQSTSTATPSPAASSAAPTESSNPTQTPAITPTAPWTYPSNLPTQTCEACGMDVNAESQARYKVTDGNGKVHYVECFMCALNLVNDYETLHIETFCDWYGPNYPIAIDSTNYGAALIVSPSTAIFLRGGSCVTARAAYNQTAADNLLAKGFSQYTSPEQQYPLPSTTQVKLVNDAIGTWYAQPNTTATPASLTLVLISIVGIAVVAGSIFAFKKMKRS